jgi:hypothetical protein
MQFLNARGKRFIIPRRTAPRQAFVAGVAQHFFYHFHHFTNYI